MATYANNALSKTSGYVAKEALLGLVNNSLLLPAVDRQYSSEFGIQAGGARVGKTIRVKSPAQFTTVSGTTLDSSTVQAVLESEKVLTLDKREGVHFEFDSEQLTFEIDGKGGDMSERVLQPAGHALGAKIESDGFAAAAKFANNAIVVAGGYTAANLKKNMLDAKVLLQKQLAPAGNRWAMIDSGFEANVADQVTALFHANSEIEQAFKEGSISTYAGLKWGASDLVYVRTNGAGGQAGITVGAAYTAGSETITVAGANAANIVVGDKITFASCLLVNPETKAVYYSTPVQRAVKAVNGSVLTIDPLFDTGSRKNCSALPSNGSAITVLGVAGKHYACQLVFQKSAITFASADLYLPQNVEMASREKAMDVSVRFVRDYQIGTDALPSRLEAIYTWSLLRPEWAVSVEVQVD